MKGVQKLRDELDHLKSVKRPKVIAAIAEAREHGDLKENAEYHAAREEQGFIEGRIKQLEGELSHAEIIDVSKLNAGSKVHPHPAARRWPGPGRAPPRLAVQPLQSGCVPATTGSPLPPGQAT